MVNVLLCDDDRPVLDAISAIITNYYNGQCRIASFDDPEAALNHASSGAKVDLAILDIIMPNLSGTQLALKLREFRFACEIAFLTSSNEFAYESYQAKALGYLLKPINEAEVRELLDQFEEKRRLERRGIDIIKRNTAKRILFRDLEYVEVIQHHLYFHMKSGEVLRIYAPLSDYLDALLEHESMAQCHRSYIVNLDYVESCQQGWLTMSNGAKISITSKYKSFLDRHLHYTFGRMNP